MVAARLSPALLHLAALAILGVSSTLAGEAAPIAAALPATMKVITTAAAAHSLSTTQASLQIPVHLRGVVTCMDGSTSPGHSAFFLHDSTGGIYVMVEDRLRDAFPSGTLVDVEGVTGPGTAAPIVDFTRIHAIGHAPLPANPQLIDVFHLETGAADAKWVEVEGTVHSVLEKERYVTLQLAMMGGTIRALVLKEPGVDYLRLVDARVHIRGDAAPMFNRNNQIIGARLMVPGLSAVTVVEPAPTSPFTQPITLIDNLLRWSQLATSHHRVHLRGQVTLQWPGSSLCIRDATGGVCAQTVQDSHLAIGELVDVVGFSEAENGTPVLVDASYQDAGHGGAVTVKPITADQALLGKDDSGLIQIEGELIGSDQAASGNTLVLTSGNIIFSALIPKTLSSSQSVDWKIGSRLRITGILSVHFDVQSTAVGGGVALAKSFQVVTRSPRDVTILRSPSWWTAAHAIVLLSFLLSAVVGAMGWITTLRRRVYMQTAALTKAREEAAAIDELGRAMQEVTSQRKLTARVSATGSQQLAQLGIGFNSMLSELEESDLATKAAEAKLKNQALTDELTGLPNRRALSERLTKSVAAAKSDGRMLAVLFIDLDGFKAVNDNLGHAAGDLLLVEVARRLQSKVRRADTVSRLGGDEFTVMLTTLRDPEGAEIVAASLLKVLSQDILIEGSSVSIGASVGISLFPQDGDDAESLIQCADSAMYAAKGRGKNTVHRFTAELGSSVRERVTLENELRTAVSRQEIHLHYQPEFDLDSGKITRFEALARWTHPVLGSVSPGKFIPVAEETGQIVALGAYVLREACREAVRWQEIVRYPLQVAVNVSSIQFVRPTFVDEVAETLRETGIRPELLQIELTESIMLTGREPAANKMRQLRALGVGLAIDDFGTGYSCLSYLPALPFDTLKIDRSFVQDVARNPGAKAVVTFLIALAHSLNMKVVVEGVETHAQLDVIKRMHGTEIQGFLLGRPIADPQSMLRTEGYTINFDLFFNSQPASPFQM